MSDTIDAFLKAVEQRDQARTRVAQLEIALHHVRSLAYRELRSDCDLCRLSAELDWPSVATDAKETESK